MSDRLVFAPLTEAMAALLYKMSKGYELWHFCSRFTLKKGSQRGEYANMHTCKVLIRDRWISTDCEPGDEGPCCYVITPYALKIIKAYQDRQKAIEAVERGQE